METASVSTNIKQFTPDEVARYILKKLPPTAALRVSHSCYKYKWNKDLSRSLTVTVEYDNIKIEVQGESFEEIISKYEGKVLETTICQQVNVEIADA
jgi:hypothetical protein